MTEHSFIICTINADVVSQSQTKLQQVEWSGATLPRAVYPWPVFISLNQSQSSRAGLSPGSSSGVHAK